MAFYIFLLFLLIVGVLAIAATRKNRKPIYKQLLTISIVGIFLFYLFAQPLIIAKEGFGYDAAGKLTNADILWNFSKKEGLQLPHHILVDSNENNFDVATLKEKKYFITFWATWCEPCMREKPALEELKETLKGNSDIEFIDISFDIKQATWSRRYIKNNTPTGIQLFSKNSKETRRVLQISGIPMHFIVNPKGTYSKRQSFEAAKKQIMKTVNNSK